MKSQISAFECGPYAPIDDAREIKRRISFGSGNAGVVRIYVRSIPTSVTEGPAVDAPFDAKANLQEVRASIITKDVDQDLVALANSVLSYQDSLDLQGRDQLLQALSEDLAKLLD